MNTENNLITVFTSKEITGLYKTFLELLEDLQKDHQILVQKLEQIDPKTIHLINYFTPDKYDQLRKRVLDSGNETSRKLLQFLEFFDFTINSEKVSEAAKQKRTIVKKFVTNSPVFVE